MLKKNISNFKNQILSNKSNLNVHESFNGENTLKLRFISRREDGDFWYVQIRVMVSAKRHYLPGKSFYDQSFGSKDLALEAACQYRDKIAWEFFKKVGYDPELRDKKALKSESDKKRPKKFTKRKEAKSGAMANLHYIHLYKKEGKYNRCVIDVSVNVNGKKYHSTAYSYYFELYGGKDEALKIAKEDRNKFATLIHQIAINLEVDQSKTPEEIKHLIKAVQINKTLPTTPRDAARFVKRAQTDDFWIVAVRKKIWGKYYRVPNTRITDADFGGKHRSRVRAVKLAEALDTCISEEFKRLRKARITENKVVKEYFFSVVDEVKESFEKETLFVSEK